MLYQSTWVLFIYILYKIAFVYSGYTVLISRVITGKVIWKNYERKV
jgi:hypothetical protein